MVAVDQGGKTEDRVIGVEDDWVQLGVFYYLGEFFHLAVFQVKIDHRRSGEHGFLVQRFEVDLLGR